MTEPVNHWHMKKEFNLVHVIMTLAMIFSFVTFIFNFDKRIESNDLQITHLREVHQQDIEALKEQRAEDQRRIEKTLDSINLKLDKLLEKN